MKKLISLLVAAAMLTAVLAACGDTAVKPSDSPPADSGDGGIVYEGNFWEDMEFPEEVRLTFASTGTEGSGSGIATARATELLKERSGGKIIIESVYNGALGNEQSTFAQCMEGSIDITGCGSGTVSMYTPCIDVFILPFLIGTYEQEAAVMVSEEWMALRERANRDLESVTIISMTEFGMRQFATINKPIETIDDIKGLKIRSIGSPVIDEALQLVGANPVNITYSDLYSALQNKVIDGEEVNATSVSMQKHYEVINYISEIGLYPFLSMAVMSNATIERLPEGYFELIRATFAETDRWYMEEGIYEWDGRCRQDCMDHGVEFNTISDKDAWLELLTPLYDKKAAEDPMYAAFIEKALSLQ